MIKAPSFEQSPLHRPVEIKSGNEIMRSAHEVLDDIRSNFAPKLPLGEGTKNEFISVIDHLRSDDSVVVYGDDQARMVRSDIIDSSTSDNVSVPEMRLGTGNFKKRQPALDAIIEDAQLEPAIATQLNYAWTISHELGHALDTAFEHTAPQIKKGIFTTSQDLKDLAAASGIVSKLAIGDENRSFAVESERFAEGFARLYIDSWLTSRGIDKKRSLILDAMNSYREARNEEEGTMRRLGYANPYDFEAMLVMMDRTTEWEKMPTP